MSSQGVGTTASKTVYVTFVPIFLILKNDYKLLSRYWMVCCIIYILSLVFYHRQYSMEIVL